MSDEKLALWAPFDPTCWSPDEGLPYLDHVSTGNRYAMLGVVVRERDLVPCAVYQRVVPAPVPVWGRPLSEVLEGAKWEWSEDHNDTMSTLAQTLAQYRETR
jgi:hypothetical protein